MDIEYYDVDYIYIHVWTYSIHTYTVESPNKGHFGPLLSFVRKLSSLGASECTVLELQGESSFGTQAVSFVERVSLFRSVHYQRFHYIHVH